MGIVTIFQGRVYFSQRPFDRAPTPDVANNDIHRRKITRSLVTQGDHRIDARRFPRREVTGQKGGAQENGHCQR
jgi:hypothetical protein